MRVTWRKEGLEETLTSMVGAKQIKENAELNYHDELSFPVSIAALSLPRAHDSPEKNIRDRFLIPEVRRAWCH